MNSVPRHEIHYTFRIYCINEFYNEVQDLLNFIVSYVCNEIVPER